MQYQFECNQDLPTNHFPCKLSWVAMHHKEHSTIHRVNPTSAIHQTTLVQQHAIQSHLAFLTHLHFQSKPQWYILVSLPLPMHPEIQNWSPSSRQFAYYSQRFPTVLPGPDDAVYSSLQKWTI